MTELILGQMSSHPQFVNSFGYFYIRHRNNDSKVSASHFFGVSRMVSCKRNQIMRHMLHRKCNKSCETTFV